MQVGRRPGVVHKILRGSDDLICCNTVRVIVSWRCMLLGQNKRAWQNNVSCMVICTKLFFPIKFADCERGQYHEA
jgi:hypothetical protein